MPLIQSRLGTIDTMVWGDGAASFTLLHASATGPRSLTGLAERLNRSDRRIVAPAFEGYGETAMRLDDGDRLSVNRAIAEQVLRSGRSGPRILFGHSMGGLVALLTAADEARRGVPIDALILYEPILVDLLDVHQADQRAARDWDRDAVNRLGHLVTNGDSEAGISHFIEAWNETRWDDLPGSARQQLVDIAQTVVVETAGVSTCKLDRAALSALHTPTLLLRGSRSPPFVRFANEAAAQLVGNATQSVLPDCGHMGPLLRPAIVVEAVERFLTTLIEPNDC